MSRPTVATAIKRIDELRKKLEEADRTAHSALSMATQARKDQVETIVAARLYEKTAQQQDKKIDGQDRKISHIEEKVDKLIDKITFGNRWLVGFSIVLFIIAVLSFVFNLTSIG